MGGDLYVIAASPVFLKRLRRLGLHTALGEDHVLPDKHSAIATLVPLLDQNTCAACSARIFMECPRSPEEADDASPSDREKAENAGS